MSNPNPTKTSEKSGVSPDNVGISAEVPVGVRDAVFHLAEMTGTSASHHVRLALMSYLTSESAKNMLEEAERYSSLKSPQGSARA